LSTTAAKAYEDLKAGELKAIGVLLENLVPAGDAPAPATRTVLPGAKTPAVRKEKRGMKWRIEIGFAGAGNHASSMLLPAVNAQRKFGFTPASTDADSVFTGEGGDFIDTLSWWGDNVAEEVCVVHGPEKGDVQATFRFANGASGTIAYLTGGNVRSPKETMDATGGGRSARLESLLSGRPEKVSQ
jgi:hypothetical protein